MKELENVLLFNSIKVVEWNFWWRWDFTISPIVSPGLKKKKVSEMSPFVASLRK